MIERVNAAGEVAHEEAIGELAVPHNLNVSGRAVDTPVHDYAMVDDNLMLLPVVGRYLAGLDDAAARAFLDRTSTDGRIYRDVLALNAGLVLEAAGPFAADPTPAHLVERPFPSGLMSPVGLVVANPVFADDATGAIVDRGHYHGTVVWSWQQAMWVTGLRRQQDRADLGTPLKGRLRAAECRLWRAIHATADVRNSELWSWDYRDDAWWVAPFGQRAGDVTESNAVQLWSTVYLTLKPPAKDYCSG